MVNQNHIVDGNIRPLSHHFQTKGFRFLCINANTIASTNNNRTTFRKSDANHLNYYSNYFGLMWLILWGWVCWGSFIVTTKYTPYSSNNYVYFILPLFTHTRFCLFPKVWCIRKEILDFLLKTKTITLNSHRLTLYIFNRD